MVEVEVEYDYEAEYVDELSIRTGDVLTNVKQMSGGWWEGTHPSGKHGLFPENFVKVVAGVTTAESSSDPPGESLKSGGDSGDPPVELRKGKRCRVLFSYRPTHEDELELNPNELIDFICEVEDGWWRGQSSDGSVGVFPSNFVELVAKAATAGHQGPPTPTKTDNTHPHLTSAPANNDSSAVTNKNRRNEAAGADVTGHNKKRDSTSLTDSIISAASTNGNTKRDSKSLAEVVNQPNKVPPSSKPPPPTILSDNTKISKKASTSPGATTMATELNAPKLPPKPVKEQCLVLFPYTALNEDELTLTEGQTVTIISKDVEDKGWWKGEVDGKIGVFPDNFVKMIETPKPTPTQQPNNKPSTEGQSVVQKTKSSKPGLPSSKENSSPLKKTGSGLSGSLGGSHHERKHSTGSNISGGGERVSDNSRTRSSSPRVDESSSLKKPSQVVASKINKLWPGKDRSPSSSSLNKQKNSQGGSDQPGNSTPPKKTSLGSGGKPDSPSPGKPGSKPGGGVTSSFKRPSFGKATAPPPKPSVPPSTSSNNNKAASGKPAIIEPHQDGVKSNRGSGIGIDLDLGVPAGVGLNKSSDGSSDGTGKLVHLTASRVKAPKRRPPSQAFLKDVELNGEGQENENESAEVKDSNADEKRKSSSLGAGNNGPNSLTTEKNAQPSRPKSIFDRSGSDRPGSRSSLIERGLSGTDLLSNRLHNSGNSAGSGTGNMTSSTIEFGHGLRSSLKESSSKSDIGNSGSKSDTKKPAWLQELSNKQAASRSSDVIQTNNSSSNEQQSTGGLGSSLFSNNIRNSTLEKPSSKLTGAMVSSHPQRPQSLGSQPPPPVTAEKPSLPTKPSQITSTEGGVVTKASRVSEPIGGGNIKPSQLIHAAGDNMVGGIKPGRISEPASVLRSPKSEKPTTPDHKPDFGGLISGIQQRNAANQPSKNVANAAESTKQTPSKPVTNNNGSTGPATPSSLLSSATTSPLALGGGPTTATSSTDVVVSSDLPAGGVESMVDSNENLHSPVTSDSSHKVSSSAVHHKLGQDNQLNSKAVDNSTLCNSAIPSAAPIPNQSSTAPPPGNSIAASDSFESRKAAFTNNSTATTASGPTPLRKSSTQGSDTSSSSSAHLQPSKPPSSIVVDSTKSQLLSSGLTSGSSASTSDSSSADAVALKVASLERALAEMKESYDRQFRELRKTWLRKELDEERERRIRLEAELNNSHSQQVTKRKPPFI